MQTFRWRRLGLIFDPARHQLPFGCSSYAQSPQALVLHDRVRVYFSTRTVDAANGKYLSHVAYADFDRSMRTLLQVSSHPVMPLGSLGAFDEHGIFPISVLQHEDQVLAYTTGWSRRVSVSVETSIGLAESIDGGETFRRIGTGPVLTSSLREPCLVGDGFVRVFDGVYHMWYIFGTGWRRFEAGAPPDRTYKIGHAVSADGIAWVKEEARQIIPDRLGEHESQALPAVIRIDNRFHMFFCYRQSSDFRKNPARGYRIGHAVSDDLSVWQRDDDNPALVTRPGEWDSDMACYPNVFECDGRIHLLYNGNAFGRHGFGLAILER